MIIEYLLTSFVLLFGYMTGAFLRAKALNRIDTVDVAWAGGFMAVAIVMAIYEPEFRTILVAALVLVWGFRLASHINARTKFRSDDPRYHELVSKWKGDIWRRAYFSIFLLQGALVWIISLPIVMNTNPQLNNSDWLIWLGAIVWIKGFVIEAVADKQLSNFLKLKDRPKVLQTGLWKYSRHPNYFGELLMWWGIGIIALSASYGWVGLIGPLLLSYLIIFVSGLPPIERRRLKDSEYQDYKQRTSPLIPWPPKQ